MLDTVDAERGESQRITGFRLHDISATLTEMRNGTLSKNYFSATRPSCLIYPVIYFTVVEKIQRKYSICGYEYKQEYNSDAGPSVVKMYVVVQGEWRVHPR